MKKPQLIRYTSKRTGNEVVYSYPQRHYRMDAAESCRRQLELGPLRLIRKKSGGTRWRARDGHAYNDATVQALIKSGYAECRGEVIVRRQISP